MLRLRTTESGTRQISGGFRSSLLTSMLAVLCLVAYPALATAGVKASYLYNLANFTGVIRYSAPRISVDKERKEVSVLYQNSVAIFNESGMETYRFGDDLDLGSIADITTDGDGNILLLSYKWSESRLGNWFEITRCNFRGDPMERIVLKGPPAWSSGFMPHRIAFRNGRLYLVDVMGLRILVTDSDGNFKEGFDLASLIGLDEKQKDGAEIFGFSVGDDGSMLFTIPTLFSAYRLYLGGNFVSFGKPGSAPGKFNIVSGIITDSKGNYLVVDRLKCTIMVFDKNFKYMTQFGFRGYRPGNLIAPDAIDIDESGRLYVTQNGRRGVSVYKITYD